MDREGGKYGVSSARTVQGRRVNAESAEVTESRSEGWGKRAAATDRSGRGVKPRLRRAGTHKSHCLGGEGAATGAGLVGGAGFVHGFEGLGGVKKTRGVNLRDVTAREEGDGDVGGRHRFREFGDGEDIEGIQSKENCVEITAKRFDGCADGFKAILIFDDAAPSGAREADLVREMRHAGSFSEKGSRLRFGQCAWMAEGSQVGR